MGSMDRQNTPEQRFYITGMDCAACAATLEKGVGQLAGVQACTVSFATEVMRVEGEVTPETVAARVRELGYDVKATEAAREGGATAGAPHFLAFMWQQMETRLALLGAALILPGLLFNELLPFLGWEHPLLNLTSVAAMITAGYPVARSAWRSLRINREININVLMTIASLGALAIGAYTEGGLVMVLFAIGEALEGFTAQRARQAIRSLMAVAPPEATRRHFCVDCAGHLGQGGYTGGPCPFCPPSEQRVPVAALAVGDEIVVKPGERIAMDGEIVSGASSVNQAPITGESMPVAKGRGDGVYAGSINLQGALIVRVTHLAADNTISRIVQMVEEAQEKRAPAQRLVDRFARRYTPAVVALALLTAILPPLLWGQPFLNPDAETTGWLYRALALLVVACPCALVISTPVSLISAISNAAHHGVLIKGGAFVEALAGVRAVAFDKTGTLTAGKPAVVKVQSVACQNPQGACEPCDDLLALASAVEQRSEHPMAYALVQASAARGVQHRYSADEVTALVGRGVRGQVNGQAVTVGSHAFFDVDQPHPQTDCQAAQTAAANGETPLLVSAGADYLGYITVADRVRQSSRAAVAGLREAGIPHLVMLTGDNEATARQIGAEVGVTEVRAGLMPEDKLKAIEALRQQYGPVAMVGDGINDAPALASADVGIAMGAAGTAQAMETADVALLSDDLSKLPFAVRLSRAAMRTIRANVALSLGIKLAFLLLVLAGMGTMWMAVLADVGASLLVTLNGMRLLRQPAPLRNVSG